MAVGEIEIRDGNQGDREAVMALWTEAFVGSGPEARREPYEPEDFDECIREGSLFVASIDGAVAGVAVLFEDDPEAITVAGETEVFRLAVAARARRRGVGRMLVERCHERARELGAEAVALWSGPSQAAAHRLYESLGYRRVPERDAVTPDGRRQLVFRLELG